MKKSVTYIFFSYPNYLPFQSYFPVNNELKGPAKQVDTCQVAGEA